MSAIMAEADSEALEALFDSIVKDNSAHARAAAPKAEVEAEAVAVVVRVASEPTAADPDLVPRRSRVRGSMCRASRSRARS